MKAIILAAQRTPSGSFLEAFKDLPAVRDIDPREATYKYAG